MINVKPSEGLRVRDPQTYQVLPPEGGTVPDTNFWRRRLAAGDVVEIKDVADQEEQTNDQLQLNTK